jgi:hypothetical protein
MLIHHILFNLTTPPPPFGVLRKIFILRDDLMQIRPAHYQIPLHPPLQKGAFFWRRIRGMRPTPVIPEFTLKGISPAYSGMTAGGGFPVTKLWYNVFARKRSN